MKLDPAASSRDNGRKRGRGVAPSYLSRRTSASIVNKMENRRRTVNIGRLEGRGHGELPEPRPR